MRVDHLGGALDPHACFLLHRGLETLAVRVRYQCQSALEIASFLARHPRVVQVHYPGLERHPYHARARQWLAGTGGMLSFELDGGAPAADQLFGRLTVLLCAPSLGGPETLITRPATTSHAGMAPEVRRRQGITDGLIRLSVGLESTQDLIGDFTAALG